MTVLFDGEIFADYHQMVLRCAEAEDVPILEDEAVATDRICPGDGVLVITTQRDMMAPLRVELHAERPTLDPAPFDHLVETAMDVPSGALIIEGLIPAEPGEPHAVPAGRLGALVAFANLAAIDEDGQDGEDRYAVHLWPSPETGPITVIVHKRYTDPLD